MAPLIPEHLALEVIEIVDNDELEPLAEAIVLDEAGPRPIWGPPALAKGEKQLHGEVYDVEGSLFEAVAEAVQRHPPCSAMPVKFVAAFQVGMGLISGDQPTSTSSRQSQAGASEKGKGRQVDAGGSSPSTRQSQPIPSGSSPPPRRLAAGGVGFAV